MCGKDRGLGRFESERNEAGESAGLILQFAELAQMIDPLLERLDVPIEHGASAAAAHWMPGPMNIEPFGGGFFATADLVAHNRIENFRAAASDRAESGFAQSLQRIADRHPENPLSQMAGFDRGKSLDVKIRIERAQTSAKAPDTILFSASDAIRPPCALR